LTCVIDPKKGLGYWFNSVVLNNNKVGSPINHRFMGIFYLRGISRGTVLLTLKERKYAHKFESISDSDFARILSVAIDTN
jgi:hypothetical protein